MITHNNKIAVIGAGRDQNELIKKVRDLGYETHVFSWQSGDEGEYSADYFYPISIMNKSYILEECKRLKPLSVITCSSDLAVGTVEKISSELGLKTNSKYTVNHMTDKISFRRLLAENSICQPAFFEVSDTIPEEIFNCLSYPMVVKPGDRSGGRGVKLVHNLHELMTAISEARDISFSRKVIVEEYIPGIRVSSENISFNHTHHTLMLTLNEYDEENGQFIEKSNAVYHGQKEIENMVVSVTKKVLDVLKYEFGASHVEFIIGTDEQIYVIEASGCMTGDFVGSRLVPLATGCDYMKMVVDVSLSQEIEIVNNACIPFRIIYVYTKEDYSAFELKSEQSDSIVESRLFLSIEGIPEKKYHGKKYGYYIEKGDNA